MSTNNYTKMRFSANDAALVLIDHQSGITQVVLRSLESRLSVGPLIVADDINLPSI